MTDATVPIARRVVDLLTTHQWDGYPDDNNPAENYWRNGVCPSCQQTGEHNSECWLLEAINYAAALAAEAPSTG